MTEGQTLIEDTFGRGYKKKEYYLGTIVRYSRIEVHV